jgi:protein TonB
MSRLSLSASRLDRVASRGPKGFLRALAASLIAHAALLAWFPDLRSHSPRPATAPLTAVLVPTEPRIEEPPPAKPPTRAPEALPQPRQRQRVPTKAATAVRAAPSAPRVPALEPPPPPEPAALGEPSTPAADAADDSAQVARANEPAIVAKPGDHALDIGSIGKYRFALSGAMARHKTYPEVARERGWEGRPVVRFVVAASGAARVQLQTSSGREVLDRAALDMAERAQRLVPVPPPLHGTEFTVEVPVVYELRGER